MADVATWPQGLRVCSGSDGAGHCSAPFSFREALLIVTASPCCVVSSFSSDFAGHGPVECRFYISPEFTGCYPGSNPHSRRNPHAEDEKKIGFYTH